MLIAQAVYSFSPYLSSAVQLKEIGLLGSFFAKGGCSEHMLQDTDMFLYFVYCGNHFVS